MADNFGTAFDVIGEDTSLYGPREGMGEAKKSPEDLAKEVEEYFDYYKDQLSEPYRKIVRYTRLFLNEMIDKRLAHEKWRAFVPVPYPWGIVKTISSSFNELVLGMNPPIQADSVGPEDMGHKKIERLFDYVFRRIKFQSEMKRFVEEMAYQGIAVRKNTLITQEKQVMVHPEPFEAEQFENAIAQAAEQTGEIPPLNDPQAFEEWRNKALQVGLAVPDMPIPGPRTVRKYKGPGFLRVSIFDMLFDPHEADMNDQYCVIQRSIKPREWVLERTGPEAEKIFDPELVQRGLEAYGDNKVNEWQTEISALYGLKQPDFKNPRLEKSCEIWEAWMPTNKDASYRVILNRKIMINKNPHIPYFHGEHPYIFARNNTVSGNAIGVSEFKPVERLFYEMNTFRGLRLDAMLLEILPVFVKGKDTSFTEQARNLYPGKIVETQRPDAVAQLTKTQLDPAFFREMQEIKNDIDEALGTLPVIRGQQSQPRVPATSTERAFNSTFARIKDRVIEFEGEIGKFIENSLFMLYQFWPSEHRVRVGGDPKMDPFVVYKRDDFVEALDADYAFRGARTALNRDLQLQNLKEWFTILVNSQLMTFKPDEMARYITSELTNDMSDRFFLSEQEMQAQQQEQMEGQPAEGEEAPPEEAPPA